MPIKVLFVHRDLVFHGGIPRNLLNLALGIEKNVVDMHVASFQPPSGDIEHLLVQSGVRVHYLGDNGYLGPMLRMRQLIRHERYDVIITCSFKSFLVAKLASVGTGQKAKIGFWIQAVPLVIEGFLRRALFRLLAQHDPLIFNSDATCRAHRSVWHRGKSWVIYNGVSPACGTNAPYPRTHIEDVLQVPENGALIGYIAEFIGLKDHNTLLHAFAKVVKSIDHVYLVLIGVGDLMPQVQRVARELRIDQQVRFLGARADARRLLGLFDVYVHPSRGEGFGLAVVEAMLAGRPVIVADEGALPELVRHRDTGIVFQAGNVDQLASHIEWVLRNREEARMYGIRAQEDASHRFNLERFVKDMQQVLVEIVEGA